MLVRRRLLFPDVKNGETTVTIEEKAKKVLQASVDLEHALMVLAHDLKESCAGTPTSQETVEQIVRASLSRTRYDDHLRRLIEGAATAGHLRADYIQGVIEGLQDKRDESNVLHKLFALGERVAQAGN